MGLRIGGVCHWHHLVLDMSAVEWLVLISVILVASIGAGLVLGLIARSMGSDDRDNSQPAGLWSGHERRKVRAGSHHD